MSRVLEFQANGHKTRIQNGIREQREEEGGTT